MNSKQTTLTDFEPALIATMVNRCRTQGTDDLLNNLKKIAGATKEMNVHFLYGLMHELLKLFELGPKESLRDIRVQFKRDLFEVIHSVMDSIPRSTYRSVFVGKPIRLDSRPVSMATGTVFDTPSPSAIFTTLPIEYFLYFGKGFRESVLSIISKDPIMTQKGRGVTSQLVQAIGSLVTDRFACARWMNFIRFQAFDPSWMLSTSALTAAYDHIPGSMYGTNRNPLILALTQLFPAAIVRDLVLRLNKKPRTDVCRSKGAVIEIGAKFEADLDGYTPPVANFNDLYDSSLSEMPNGVFLPVMDMYGNQIPFWVDVLCLASTAALDRSDDDLDEIQALMEKKIKRLTLDDALPLAFSTMIMAADGVQMEDLTATIPGVREAVLSNLEDFATFMRINCQEVFDLLNRRLHKRNRAASLSAPTRMAERAFESFVADMDLRQTWEKLKSVKKELCFVYVKPTLPMKKPKVPVEVDVMTDYFPKGSAILSNLRVSSEEFGTAVGDAFKFKTGSTPPHGWLPVFLAERRMPNLSMLLRHAKVDFVKTLYQLDPVSCVLSEKFTRHSGILQKALMAEMPKAALDLLPRYMFTFR